VAPSERKVRKFVRQWRRRYPLPVPWVDDRANKQCRRSEDLWLAQFAGADNLRRREVISLVVWRLGGDREAMERALAGIDGPAAWGHARRSIKKALAATNPMEALDRLVGEVGAIPGWTAVMASALLAACRPDLYVAGDDRALRSLAALDLLERTEPTSFTRGEWWPYLRACRRLAELADVSVRDVGRALWAGADDAPDLPSTAKAKRRAGPVSRRGAGVGSGASRQGAG